MASSPHGVLASIAAEAEQQGTIFIVLGLIATALLLRLARDSAELRARMQAVVLLVCLHLLLLPVAGIARGFGAGVALDLRLVGAISGTLAAVAMAGLVVFRVLLGLARMSVPGIVQDVIIASVALLAVFGTASRAGVNLSGIVATGAVLTAVIGLGLQDTLGNVLGGLALQLDGSVRVGDWVRVQEWSGRVVEIRWRSTTIETRAWETVVIPNSVLTKSNVVVLGRTGSGQSRWRRSVTFSVDFRHPPSQVIELVQNALRLQVIRNVASDPMPDCVLSELGDSSARYTVRYFLTDFARDEATDSVVRTRLYFALARSGIAPSIPAQALFVTEESDKRKERKHASDLQRRLQVLSGVDLLSGLSDEERGELARSLTYAPFHAGEALTHEGADEHDLFVVERGVLSVRLGEGSAEREVARLGPGELVGEMSLLTGEKRSATVVALENAQCYRLEAAAFRQVLERRPDLAEKLAERLAERRVALLATRESIADRRSMVDTDKRALIDKIRTFFRL
jgi:small-conductance mechanosensitive channel/CRP-like cAMP-binding protein